jgi:hypothetical protein
LGITTMVSCLPVLVLAMGTALAHMLRGDAAAADGSRPAGPPDGQFPVRSAQDQPADHPGQEGTKTMAGTRTRNPARTAGQTKTRARTSSPARSAGSATPPAPARNPFPARRPRHNDEALRIARKLAAEGRPVSRRALRCGGVKGSNENLNALARLLNAELAAGLQVPS